MEIREVFAVDAIRTPIGKFGGVLKDVRPDDLAALMIKSVVNRNGLEPSSIDDVVFGCGNQAGEDNRDVARMAVLLSGLPYTVPGVTVNRLCGSGLEAVNSAANAIATGNAEIVIAGGVESMTRAPYAISKSSKPFERGLQIYDTTIGWRFVNPKMAVVYPPISLGETAENLAEKYKIPRQKQDEFSLDSHKKAVAATKTEKFKEEIIPVVVQKDGETLSVDKDEGPRENTSLEALSRLKPSFKATGTVTAGNSSQISDGAAGILLASRDSCDKLGLRPMARYLGAAVAGVDPSYMGIGPVPATKKLLEKTRFVLEDIDLVEINEAFAAQILAVLEELPVEPRKLNPNGGAIALGHPIGCSGARLVVTLLREMRRRHSKMGLTTLCIGVGQGIATLFEQAQ